MNHTTAPAAPSPDYRERGDEELLLRAREGDSDAFAELLTRHAPWLEAKARDLAPSDGRSRSAQDFVQIVHERAWRDFLRRKDGAAQSRIQNARAWLMRVLHNAVVDSWRRRASRPDRDSWTDAMLTADAHGDRPPERSIADWTAAPHAQQLFARLKPQDQRILQYASQDDMKDAEIATALCMTPDAVKKRRQRALHWLRCRLSEPGPIDPPDPADTAAGTT